LNSARVNPGRTLEIVQQRSAPLELRLRGRVKLTATVRLGEETLRWQIEDP